MSKSQCLRYQLSFLSSLSIPSFPQASISGRSPMTSPRYRTGDTPTRQRTSGKVVRLIMPLTIISPAHCLRCGADAASPVAAHHIYMGGRPNCANNLMDHGWSNVKPIGQLSQRQSCRQSTGSNAAQCLGCRRMRRRTQLEAMRHGRNRITSSALKRCRATAVCSE